MTQERTIQSEEADGADIIIQVYLLEKFLQL